MSIEDEILDYLEQHPAARDTVEGVTAWWLMEPHLERSVVEVKAALDRLVDRGRLRVRLGADGRALYGVHPDRAGQSKDKK